MNRRELGLALMWLLPMLGSGIISWLVPPATLLWGLAVTAAVLSGANVALHIDLVAARPSGI